MKVSAIIYGILLTSSMLTHTSIASTSEPEKLLSYSNFGIDLSDFDDSEDVLIFKITTTTFEHSMKDSYEMIVGSDLAVEQVELEEVILADNFENIFPITKSFINGKQVGVTRSNFTGIRDKDAITILYPSSNNDNRQLSFRFPIHDIDISNMPIVSEPSSTGVAAENMAIISIMLKQNHTDLNKTTPLPNLVFPEGSRCLLFGKVNTNLPSYEFELNSYDPLTNKWVSNKLNYKTIDELIADKSSKDDAYLNVIVEYVGINNKNKTIRIPTDHKYIDTAYVEYDNAVYETFFLKDYPDHNSDPEQGMIQCTGFNDVATEYLETEIINGFQ